MNIEIHKKLDAALQNNAFWEIWNKIAQMTSNPELSIAENKLVIVTLDKKVLFFKKKLDKMSVENVNNEIYINLPSEKDETEPYFIHTSEDILISFSDTNEKRINFLDEILIEVLSDISNEKVIVLNEYSQDDKHSYFLGVEKPDNFTVKDWIEKNKKDWLEKNKENQTEQEIEDILNNWDNSPVVAFNTASVAVATNSSKPDSEKNPSELLPKNELEEIKIFPFSTASESPSLSIFETKLELFKKELIQMEHEIRDSNHEGMSGSDNFESILNNKTICTVAIYRNQTGFLKTMKIVFDFDRSSYTNVMNNYHKFLDDKNSLTGLRNEGYLKSQDEFIDDLVDNFIVKFKMLFPNEEIVKGE